MKTLLNISFVLLGSLSLVACSYFDKGDDLTLDGSKPPVSETIDLTKAAPGDAMTAPEVQVEAMPQHFEPPPNLEQVVNDSTKGSVDIYPDGDGAVPKAPQQAPQGMPPGESTYSFTDSQFTPVNTVSTVPVDAQTPSVVSGDPSVEVFPLDGPVGGATPSSAPMMDARNVVNNGDEAIVYFAHDATGLDSKGVADVKKMAALHNVARAVSVEGYASTESSQKDPVKRKIANLKVSMDRAFSVASILIQRGVPAEMISTVAYGEAKPGPTAAQSRRVEIHGLSGQ